MVGVKGWQSGSDGSNWGFMVVDAVALVAVVVAGAVPSSSF